MKRLPNANRFLCINAYQEKRSKLIHAIHREPPFVAIQLISLDLDI